MNLLITHHNNCFKVIGTLNRQSVPFFQNELGNALSKMPSITVNIEEVNSMDKYGVMAFAQLYNTALQNHKAFFITGLGCKELYDHFKSVEAA